VTGGDQVPSELRYTKSHEWVKVEGNDLVVGITDHAQSELTDIVYVDLPKVGMDAPSGGNVLALESVKTVADVFAPVAGKVVAVNDELKAHPEHVNSDPYGKGWLFRMAAANPPPDLSGLLDADGYRAHVQAGG
jgi:glycine cleavage system H protein